MTDKPKFDLSNVGGEAKGRIKDMLSDAVSVVIQLAIGIVVLVFSIFAILFIISKVSVNTYRYECQGKSLSKIDYSESKTRLFMEMELYKFPITLWSKSAGSITYEAENKSGLFFSPMGEGDKYVLLKSGNDLVGGYSFISGKIDVNVGDNMTFSGICKKNND